MAKVTDIQDKNGVSKEIQDKDLANRTAQSSVASSDYVLLEDTSGQYHKIAKASFTEAVRGALGSVINSVAKGSDIAKMPVLDSNNDLGMGTLANIASVLGVPLYNEITLGADVINPIQTAYSSAGQYTKFDGTAGQAGYFIGFKYGSDGKAAVVFISGGSVSVICRNHGSISSGIWKGFMVVG